MSLFQIDAGRDWRGGQRQAFLLTRELAGRGYPVLLVAQPESPLEKKAAEAGLRVLPVEIKNDAHIQAGWKIGRAMRRESCLLAHFHDGHAAGVGGRAARLARVPVRIVTRRVEYPLKANRFSRNKYAEADAVIAISQRVRDVLLEGGVPDDRIEVIPSGIDLEPFAGSLDRDYLRREFGFPPDSFLVGIVAQLVDGKGHGTLIEAAKLLKTFLPKIKIIIIGGGALELRLAEQARGLGVGDLVFFLGFREDVPRLLASLDAFVLTSDAEGLGSSIMDAMAARLPVVATRVGGIPEVVEDGETGILIPPRDPETLARTILRLANDRELAGRLGAQGFESVQRKFSAEAMVSRIVDLYEKIAAPKKINLRA